METIKPQDPSEFERYRELALLVVESAPLPTVMTRTQLYRTLFVIDALAVNDTGRSITGVTYHKYQDGPRTPFSLDDLNAVIASAPAVSSQEPALVALRAADLKYFTPAELDVVSRVLAEDAIPGDDVHDGLDWVSGFATANYDEPIEPDAARVE